MATSENTDLDSARQASAHHQVTPLGFAPPAPILNHRVSVDLPLLAPLSAVRAHPLAQA
jgi:hypothetical protein